MFSICLPKKKLSVEDCYHSVSITILLTTIPGKVYILLSDRVAIENENLLQRHSHILDDYLPKTFFFLRLLGGSIPVVLQRIHSKQNDTLSFLCLFHRLVYLLFGISRSCNNLQACCFDKIFISRICNDCDLLIFGHNFRAHIVTTPALHRRTMTT